MHDNFNLLTLQRELGYTFKDPSLAKSAFIHRSYNAKGEENNVRLIFLGRQLLSFVLCDYITSRLPYTDEKQLSYQAESYLENLGTEYYIKDHGLADLIMMSEINEPLRYGASLGKEIFLALCAAIYRDGGLPSLKGFLMPIIRSCGGDDHYKPSRHGQVLTNESTATEQNHIKNEKLRRPSKSGSIGITKAVTVEKEEVAKPLSKKEEKKKQKEEKKKKKEEKTEEITAPAPSEKKFIRDPFAPVRLSDDLRNFKPKKPSKYDTVNEPQPESPSAPVKKDDQEEQLKIGKTLLQEYVQKNLRTANVLLKYSQTQIGKNLYRGQATLDGKVIGTYETDNKQKAERGAAYAAYLAISDTKSKEHKWFFSLSEKDVTPSDKSGDYVSKINQYFQQTMHLSCAPIVYERRQKNKKNDFHAVAVYDGREIGEGFGKTPKEAKQNAAREACKTLGIK